MTDAEDTTELAQWARERAQHAPDELVRAMPERVAAMHFRPRALVLDAALSARHEITIPLLRSLARSLDEDSLRATLESLPPSTLASVLCLLSATPDALFALGLAAWPGPLSCVSIARTRSEFPGDEDCRRSLTSVLAGPFRASSRVRAVFELVAMGSHADTVTALDHALDDTVHDIRTAAVRALARLRAERPLLRALGSPHATVRADARLLLVQLVARRDLERERVIAAFERIAEDLSKRPRERFDARRTLRELGEPVERVPWSGLHEDAAESLAHEIKTIANRLAIHEYVSVLADADDPRGLEAVRDALAHAPKVGRALAGFRAFFKGPHGARALKQLSRDPDPIVRERAVELAGMRG